MTENNNNTTHQLVKKLAEREGVTEETIKKIITESLRRSYCQGENTEADLFFDFANELLVYRTYQIVSEVNNPKKEIAKGDELLKTGQVKDNIFFLPLDIKNLPLDINYEIKKQLHKDIGKIHEERNYKLFKSLQGELVWGSVQDIQENYYVVNLGKGLGYWDKKEWILPEKPRLGQRFCFLLKEVKVKSEVNQPQIILTRQDSAFLHKLLESEIPEINKGIIAIRYILREPGLLSKVIIESKRFGISPLGACIGQNSERIRTICRLISPERIDLVAWTENKKEFLFNLLAPAKVVSLVERGDDWDIIVPQKKASLLLEHEGRVLKEIGKCLEKNLHVRILEDLEKEKNVIIVWNGNLDYEDYQKLL